MIPELIGQYASFTRAVVGQLHLNGFPFSCLLCSLRLESFKSEYEYDEYDFLNFNYSVVMSPEPSLLPFTDL